MKILKIILLAALSLALLLVVALVAVINLIDLNRQKDRIARIVYEQTGRELRIAGDLEWELWPKLRLAGGGITLGNAPGFGPEPFLTLESFQFSVATWPLTRSEVIMDLARVSGLRLNLARNEAGVGNWEDLAAGPPAPGRPAKGDGLPLAALVLGGINIEGVGISWQDKSSGQEAEVRDLHLRVGPLRFGEPITLEVEFQARSRQPELAAAATINGTLAYDLERGRYSLQPLTAALDLHGPTVPGGSAEVTLHARLELDHQGDRAVVSEFKAAGLGLKLQAGLKAEQLRTRPVFELDMELSPFSPRALLSLLELPIPATADRQALSRLALNTRVSGTPNAFLVRPLELHLDDSRLQGEIKVNDLTRADIAFQIEIDQLDLDRYLPPEAEKAPATPEVAAAAASGLPVETLRNLRVNGELKIADLKVSGLRMQNFRLAIRAADGLIAVEPLQSELYQGSMQGSFNLDARGAEPLLKAENRISGVQAGPLLRDLTGERERLRGRAEIDYQLATRGAALPAMKGNLNGEAVFAFRDGAVVGVNIGRLLRQASAMAQGRTLAADRQEEVTDFTELTGTAQIRNGLVSNQDLSLKSPLLRLEGRGTANLVSEQVDYLLHSTVVATAKGQQGRELEELRGITVPIRVSGTFAGLRFRPELEAAGLEQLQQNLQELGRQLRRDGFRAFEKLLGTPEKEPAR